MYEITILNKTTKEEDIIFGYSVKDAFRRCKSLNPDEWVVLMVDYID